MKLGLTFQFLLLISYLNVIHTTTCSCDLLVNGCDINCCCDPDCSADDKKIFNTCTKQNSEHIEEICMSDDLLFAVNGKYQIEGTGGGLLCLYKNNYNARFFYSDVTAVTTATTFEELAKKYRKTSYDVREDSTTNYGNSFRVGDPLFIIHTSTKQQGFLPLPSSFLSNKCEDGNPAGFLLPLETDCLRIVKEFTNDCQNEPSWNARKYYEGFQVAPFPSFVFGKKQTTVDPATNKTIIISQPVDPFLESFICRNTAGKIIICPFTQVPLQPTYDNATNSCKNVLQEVQYSIKYRQNVTVEITQVNVTVFMGDVSSSFNQRTIYSFVAEGNLLSNNTNKTGQQYFRSGNPGYIIGLPVIVANMINNTIYPSYLNDSIKITTMKTTSKGSCVITGQRENVAFGVDLRTGCLQSVKSTITLDECKKLQEDIFEVLVGKVGELPTHVASFGNPDQTKLTDWIKLINKGPNVEATLNNGQCFNMRTSVLFEFLYADTGFLKNPQRKIVGARVKYGTLHNLLSDCSGLLCKDTFKVEVVQAVSFVDVTQTPQAEIKSKPEFKSKAPNDFFYPFST